MDMGANAGYFPIKLAGRGVPAVALDSDPKNVRTTTTSVLGTLSTAMGKSTVDGSTARTLARSAGHLIVNRNSQWATESSWAPGGQSCAAIVRRPFKAIPGVLGGPTLRWPDPTRDQDQDRRHSGSGNACGSLAGLYLPSTPGNDTTAVRDNRVVGDGPLSTTGGSGLSDGTSSACPRPRPLRSTRGQDREVSVGRQPAPRQSRPS